MAELFHDYASSDAHERKGAAPKDNACGRFVMGADGKRYRVTMRASTAEPWGRLDGDDKNEPVEIPRPFREVKR